MSQIRLCNPAFFPTNRHSCPEMWIACLCFCGLCLLWSSRAGKTLATLPVLSFECSAFPLLAWSGSLLTNVAEFESKIPALLELRGPHVVFFTADPDPTTGRPWCPDCARSEGAIREEVETSGGSLLEVQVKAS